MTSPNEPATQGQDAADSPPWQRGAARASEGTRQQVEQPTDVRPAAAPVGADARLNRFISGSTTPATGGSASRAGTKEAEAAPARGDSAPADAYASELPDLSGPIPRSSQRAATPDRSSEPAGPTGRSTTSESRESRVQISRRTRSGPVRASMQIRRIDPWSTLKVSLTLSVALFFVWMVAVAFLYLVLGGMGVWAKLNSNVGDLLNNTSGSTGELVSAGTIFGGAVLIGLVNIVLLTAMATIAAFVYNLATDLIGGVEVTLADRD